MNTTEAADGYDIGPLVEADVEPLGALHCRVWQVTYRELLSPEVLAGLSPERFARGWRRRYELLAAGQPLLGGEQVLIARWPSSRAQPVGFISIGEPREQDAPTPRQLWALNVLPEHQGTGVAQTLMTAGLGDGPAYLWVAQGNERAIRFYTRHGFTADGTESEREDGMTELRMVRR